MVSTGSMKVGENTNITIALQTADAVPSDGLIKIYFPKWNSGA
jgi:hypothetical protein